MPVRPPIFRPSGARTNPSASRRQHDQRRGSARERGYTTEWDRAALHFVAGAPLCLGCEAVGRLQPTELVDHVEPHRGDREKFWNELMWQPSCRWHHDVVKKRLEALFDQGRIGISDLWLDSQRAQALTIDLLRDRDDADEA